MRTRFTAVYALSIYISLDVACAERGKGATGYDNWRYKLEDEQKKYIIERKDGKTSLVFLISLNTFSSAPFHILTLFIVYGGHIYYFPFYVFLFIATQLYVATGYPAHFLVGMTVRRLTVKLPKSRLVLKLRCGWRLLVVIRCMSYRV